MNHDDQNSHLKSLIDPELEARIVAWVAGEASAFEIAELTRLTGEKPELGIFKRRIEAVHGLVGEAVRPDQLPLRLSDDRRAKLLQAIGGGATKLAAAAAPKPIVQDFNATKRAHRKYRQWVTAVTMLAACAAVGLFTLMSVPHFGTFREMNAKQAATPAGAFGKREEAPRIAEQDAKRRELEIQLELPTVGDDSASRFRYKQETPSKELARKDQIERLAQASAQEAKKSVLQFSEALGAGKAAAPLIASATSSTPLPSADDEKIVLSPFEITKTKGAGYLSQNTAAIRARTDLSDVASAISPAPEQRVSVGTYAPALPTVSVTSPQFSSDTGAMNGRSSYYISTLEMDGTKGNPGSSGAPVLADSVNRMHGAVRIDPQLFGVANPQGPRVNYEKSAPASPAADQFRADLSKTVGQLAANSPIDAEGKNLVDKKADADLPLAPPPAKPAPIAAPAEVNASKEPVSTFSLHVSDVSFRLAQAALAANESIDPSRIRPEEFYNAFSYGDPTPALAEKVSCRIEQAAHPFLQQRNLVRIALKVAASGRDAAQPLHLTVLLDHSGSMEREDRMATVQRAMQSLVSLLGPNDRITLIGFARQPSLLAESLTGDQSAQLLDIIARTPAEGGTNLEEALKLGGELARRQFEPNAQNRIVLLTDGAANLGNANPEQLATAIEALRQQGIAFDACGVGLEGLDDAMLENLTRKGDGRYYVLNSPEAADTGFAHQLAGAFRPAAENVKLQVRFNPARVGNYRLIGFEQHRLREEDFRNDAVDAAELAAEEAAVAVYQVETLPQGEGELGEVYVRFRDASTGNMVERSWTLAYDSQSPAFDRATPSMQLAGAAALLAEKLRGGQTGDSIRLGELAPVVNKLRSHYANETRVQDLATMYEQARRRFGD